MTSEPAVINIEELALNTNDEKKVFELLLISVAAANYSHKMIDVKSQGTKGIGEFVSYYKHALAGVRSFADEHDIKVVDANMQAVISKVECNIKKAFSNTQKNTSKLRVSDYAKETWDFFAELVNLTVDSVSVISSKHKPLKGSKDEYDHNTRFKFVYGEHEWIYNVRTKGSATSEIKGFANGKEIKSMDEPMALIFFLFYKVAWVMGMDCAYDYIIGQLAHDKELTSTANKISRIISGDSARYIAAAFNIKYLQNEGEMSAEDSVARVFTEQVKCSKDELHQLKTAFA